jgi:RNA polymerase sigma-70 factor (ECF subfamily)
MRTINLRDFYSSIYSADCLCEVPDEVAELLLLYKRLEETQRRLTYKHRAHYSIDRDDGIENAALLFAPSVHEIYEQNITRQALYTAIQDLTDKQLKRLYAHFFLDMNYVQIARFERTDASSVRKSVNRALMQLKKRLDLY